MYNKNLETARKELITTSEGKVILWHETVGIWISQNASDFTMLVSSEDFDKVYDNTQVLSVSADVQLVAGISRFDQSTSVGVVNLDSTSVRWIPDSLVKKIEPGRIRNSTLITRLSDSIATVEQLFTTDAGTSWFFVPDAPNPISSVVLSSTFGILGYSIKGDCWYQQDSQRQWVPFDMGVSIQKLYYTKSGASVGIGYDYGMPVKLYYRPSDAESWTQVTSVKVSDTFTLPVPATTLGIATAATGVSNAVVLPLDSGVVLVVDHRGLTPYQIFEARMLSASTSVLDNVVTGEYAYVMYQNNGYLMNIADGAYSVLPQQRELKSAYKVITNETVFAHARPQSGLGYSFNRANHEWQATMKLYGWDNKLGWSMPAIGLYQVGTRTNLQLACGQILRLSDNGLWSMDAWKVKRIDFGQGADDHLAGFRMFNVLDDSVVVSTGTDSRAFDSSRYTPLPSEALCFIEKNASGTVYAAFQDVYRFNMETEKWDTLPKWTSTNTPTSISSVVESQGVIVASLRGYNRTYGGETLWRSEGGFMRTSNNGITWNAVASPSDGQWVEYITEGSDGSLFAWTRSVDFVGDTSKGALVAIYADDSWLVRSTDHGATWTTVYYAENRREIPKEGCWRIVETPKGLFACNADNVVVRSTDGGATWVEFRSEITDTLTIGDILYRDRSLYIAHTKGILVVPVEPLGVEDAQTTTTSCMSVGPNPFSDYLRVRVPAGQTLVGVRYCVVSNVLGEVVARIPLSTNRGYAGDDANVVIQSDNWDDGLYLVSVEGTACTAVPILRMRQ